MWLHHFRKKRRRPRYKAFQKRYHEFRPSDTAKLCDWHHEEISVINYELIGAAMTISGKRACDWSWQAADKLMQQLRDRFDRWVVTETAGMRPRHLTAAS